MKLTLWIIGVTTVLLIGYDIYIYVTPPKGDTISEVFLWLSQHPVIPFAWGVLSGHLFFPQYKREVTKTKV